MYMYPSIDKYNKLTQFCHIPDAEIDSTEINNNNRNFTLIHLFILKYVLNLK